MFVDRSVEISRRLSTLSMIHLIVLLFKKQTNFKLFWNDSKNVELNFVLLWWDQVAALLWLKDNIGGFGGDSSRITLSGHGTGAALVNLLMISPLAAGKSTFSFVHSKPIGRLNSLLRVSNSLVSYSNVFTNMTDEIVRFFIFISLSFAVSWINEEINSNVGHRIRHQRPIHSKEKQVKREDPIPKDEKAVGRRRPMTSF